jgi:alkyl hydroperoxide reductase subunit D
MTLEELSNQIPEYAKDMRVNLSNVLQQTELNPQQIWGTAVACAMASHNMDVIEAILGEAPKHLTPVAFSAAKTAAALMGMNNIYYRFQHLVGKEKYREIPARLRMQGIRTHGSDPVDFELWCLAVSAVNGCGSCIASHEAVVVQKGLTEEQVVAAVRIASVIHAVASVMDTESVPLAVAR